MLLWWQVILQEMTCLRFLQVLESLFATSYLDRIDAILLHSLHLCHLASVQLNDSARNQLSPTIPKVSHAYLVPNCTAPLTVSVNGSRFLESELPIDLQFKVPE